GASGQSLIEANRYATPLFLCVFVFIFSIGCSGILRGEGDMKRAMYAIIVSSIMNCVLDPIFIYVLGWGSAGASISTVVSVLASACFIMYFILIKKDTYVDVTFKGFKFESKIVLDILKVAIPTSFDKFIIPVAMSFYLMFIFSVGGVDGIAIFMSAQRLYLMGILPSTAISIAVSAVSGSAFGAKNWEYLSRAHTFSTKFAMAMSATVMLVLVIFAPQLSLIFAYTPETASLIPGIANFLRIAGFGLIFVGLGMPSSFLYQGIGRGTTSLVWTVIRELIFAVSFTYLFGIVFGWGLTGIWIGLAVGRGVASFLNFVYAKYTIMMLKSEGVDNDIQKRGYLSVQHLCELILVLLHQFRHESG
uniref:MATE family efflux transporter n=1 Tax=Methanobrevibacter sp. TaxID=66852 RepID=UPI00388E7E86